MSAPAIVVLGSLNADLLLRVPRVPRAGETLTGHSMQSLPGGTGGNQAVGCARQGARVTMLGRVGRDAEGRMLHAALAADGIGLDALQYDDEAPTGRALVMLEDSAQNRIIVLPGANARLQLDAQALGRHLHGARFLVMQLESPLGTVFEAVDVARANGCPVLLNPSPMVALPDSLWPGVDTLVLNEVEAAACVGHTVDSPADAAIAADTLRARGVQRVVVTLGAAGAVSVDAAARHFHPALAVAAVDTTAAGDTFTGALAASLARGGGLTEATARGIQAAALCVTRLGAQPSIPDAAEVDAMPPPPPAVSLPR